MTVPQAIAPFLVSSAVFCAIYIALGWRLDYLPRVRGHAQPPRTATKPESVDR